MNMLLMNRFLAATFLVCSGSLAACVAGDPADSFDGPGGDDASGEVGEASQAICALNGDLGSACGLLVTGSSKSGNDLSPTCAYGSAEDVAYTWTAPFAGTYTFNTFGSSFDTVLSALTSGCGSTRACNDDASGTWQSQVSVSLTAGEPIVLAVDGYGTSAGTFKLSVLCPPPPGCTIGGQAYPNGQLNPANSCQKCDVSQSMTTWSNNDGLWIQAGGGGQCKYNTCIAGGCSGNAYCSTHGASCDGICSGGAVVTDCGGSLQ